MESKMIHDIYNKAYAEIPGREETEREISEKTDRLLDGLREKVSPELYREVEDALLHTADLAEESGFVLGVKYFAKLLAQALS